MQSFDASGQRDEEIKIKIKNSMNACLDRVDINEINFFL